MQVVTALGSLEELAVKNSSLGAFPEQLIDMSGELVVHQRGFAVKMAGAWDCDSTSLLFNSLQTACSAPSL